MALACGHGERLVVPFVVHTMAELKTSSTRVYCMFNEMSKAYYKWADRHTGF